MRIPPKSITVRIFKPTMALYRRLVRLKVAENSTDWNQDNFVSASHQPSYFVIYIEYKYASDAHMLSVDSVRCDFIRSSILRN
jgi:hypothetical protein